MRYPEILSKYRQHAFKIGKRNSGSPQSVWCQLHRLTCTNTLSWFYLPLCSFSSAATKHHPDQQTGISLNHPRCFLRAFLSAIQATTGQWTVVTDNPESSRAPTQEVTQSLHLATAFDPAGKFRRTLFKALSPDRGEVLPRHGASFRSPLHVEQAPPLS